MKQRLFALFISIFLLFPPYIVIANNNIPEFIDSEDTFWEWIDSHPFGGSITIGLDITITEHIMLSGPLSIDTGAYGVTLNGGSFYELTITGEGVDTPVLTIIDPGLRFGSWDHSLPGYNVTARGRNGTGGVAVHIRSEKDGSPSFNESRGLIRSEGKNAVGVLFDHPVKAHFLSVSSEGENSTAVAAPNGSSLYYGKLEASGEGAKVVTGNGILLDTCKVTGDTSGADVVNRKIVALAGSWLYWPLAQGQEILENPLYRTFSNISMLSFLLSGDETHPAEVRKLYTGWDRDAMDNIDTSVVGETVIPGALYDIYQDLGLEDDFSLDLTVDILEAGTPCISSLVFGDKPNTGRRYVFFQIFDWNEFGLDAEDSDNILWRSDDEGQNWYKFMDSPDVSPISGGVIYYFDEITEPVWFRIQKAGGDYSNIAVIYGYEGNTWGASGGDRTGGDRGGEEPDTRPSPSVPTTSPPTSGPSVPTMSSDQDRKTAPTEQKPSVPAGTSANSSAHTQEPATPSPNDIPAFAEEEILSPELSEPASAFPAEWEDERTIAISGKRLRLMMSAGDAVIFIKNGIRLSIATSALETLDFGEQQLFTVSVECLEPLRYMISAAIDGTELYSLPCVVTLDGKDYDISVSGNFEFTGTQLPKDKITQTPDQPADNKKASAWPIAGFAFLGIGCAATGGTAAFLKLRRKSYD